jgi:hypothetical protein
MGAKTFMLDRWRKKSVAVASSIGSGTHDAALATTITKPSGEQPSMAQVVSSH